jgi:hypothetical protein
MHHVAVVVTPEDEVVAALVEVDATTVEEGVMVCILNMLVMLLFILFITILS